MWEYCNYGTLQYIFIGYIHLKEKIFFCYWILWHCTSAGWYKGVVKNVFCFKGSCKGKHLFLGVMNLVTLYLCRLDPVGGGVAVLQHGAHQWEQGLPPLRPAQIVDQRSDAALKKCSHCPNYNLNLCIKTEPFVARTVSMVFCMFSFCLLYSVWLRNETYTLAYAPTVTGSVVMQRFRHWDSVIQFIFGTVWFRMSLGQCD